MHGWHPPAWRRRWPAAAGMQADCRSLQMIAVAFCGSHEVKGVVDLRSAELRLVRADQYFAAESLFYQRQLIAAAGAISVMRSPKPVPYARPPVRQNGISAPQRGGNGAQTLYRPVQLPETIDRQHGRRGRRLNRRLVRHPRECAW